MPFRDERRLLEETLTKVARCPLGGGLEIGDVAIVGVDHRSADDSGRIFETCARRLGFGAVAVTRRDDGGIVTARRAGFEIAASAFGDARLFVSLDADTTPSPGWLAEALELAERGADAVSFVGTFARPFWSAVPTLRDSYATSVGTIFFDEATAAGSPRIADGYHHDLFAVLGRTLVDQLFAITPRAYLRSGGHHVRLTPGGSEILHEGGRLAFTVARGGHRIETARHCRYTTSARRLVGEASRLFAGDSYAGEMNEYRDLDTDPVALDRLNRSAAELDFRALRRYVVRNYILFQAICQPGRAMRLSPWLPNDLLARVARKVLALHRQCDDGFAAIVAAEQLDRELGQEIDECWKRR